MHGGLTQSRREKSLGEFRGGAQFLIATNVAARGLDIADITDIINFGAPEVNFYIHRVGRSARMGKNGKAMTIATPDQDRELRDIEYRASVEMTQIKLNIEQFRNVRLPIHEREGGRFAGRGRPRPGRFREHDDRSDGRRHFSKNNRDNKGGAGRTYLS
jgi:superfamily II DNA/RNA helicase